MGKRGTTRVLATRPLPALQSVLLPQGRCVSLTVQSSGWAGPFELAAELLPEREPLGERLSQAAAGPLEHVPQPGPPPTCPQLWLPAAVPGQTGPQQQSWPGQGVGGRMHRCFWFAVPVSWYCFLD